MAVPVVATHSSPFPGACLTTAAQLPLNVNPDVVQVSLWDSPGCLTTASDWIKIWHRIPVGKDTWINTANAAV